MGTSISEGKAMLEAKNMAWTWKPIEGHTGSSLPTLYERRG